MFFSYIAATKLHTEATKSLSDTCGNRNSIEDNNEYKTVYLHTKINTGNQENGESHLTLQAVVQTLSTEGY